jgi:hypothetical protein
VVHREEEASPGDSAVEAKALEEEAQEEDVEDSEALEEAVLVPRVARRW